METLHCDRLFLGHGQLLAPLFNVIVPVQAGATSGGDARLAWWKGE